MPGSEGVYGPRYTLRRAWCGTFQSGGMHYEA